MNYLLDNNFIIDILSERRRKKYPKSVKVYNIIQNEDNNIFISSSSLDNIEFILFKEIKAQFDYSNKEALSEVHKRIKSFMKDIKIAKTPSYIDIDYENIEDYQMVASAKAIDAKIITRDDKLIKKYPNLTITPDKFLSQYTNNQYTTIPTAIHYPMSLHLQECFKDLEYKEGDFSVAEKVSKEILSLPMNPYLRDEEIEFVAGKMTI